MVRFKATQRVSVFLLITISFGFYPTVWAKERSSGGPTKQRPASLSDLGSERLKKPSSEEGEVYVERAVSSDPSRQWKLTEPREFEFMNIDIRTQDFGTTGRYPKYEHREGK